VGTDRAHAPAAVRGPFTERVARRALDLGVAITALVLLLPLFLVVSVTIKATSPGPVFYRQTRVGRNLRRAHRRAAGALGPQDRRRSDRRARTAHGRQFQILKFRTMMMNAEEYGPQWSTPNDPRVTAVGRFLR
jgi:lipopolysaccharide/colanic/teichoic acid biosynthesis glycosyltransferase